MKAIKAHDEAIYYAGVYWNDYPLVLKELNRRVSGKTSIEWTDHFIKSQKGRVFKKALFINCGNGWVERELYKKGLFKEAVGVDYMQKLLDEAKQKAGKRPFRYYQMDINDAKFPEGEFDLIVNNAAGHHIARIDKVFRELANLLTDDGIFVNNDYVGANRNQYPLWQWALATRVNQQLPPHMRQNLQYPHLPTMLATDPSEGVHAELVLRASRRYFKTIEHRRTGGAIAYLLLTHNANFQKAKKADVEKWSKFIIDADAKLLKSWPSSSMFDYWVAVKKPLNPFTKWLHNVYDKAEERREKRAEKRDGIYYPYRLKIMQRYSIRKENKRLDRIKAGKDEQSRPDAFRNFIQENGVRGAIYQTLCADTGSVPLKVFRQLVTAAWVVAAGVFVALLALKAGTGSKIAAISGVSAGMLVGLVWGFVCASPSNARQFVKRNKHTFAAAILSVAFFGLGVATQLQGVHPSKTAGLAITYDEVSFIPSGYYYQTNGKNFLSPDHPPLVKDVGAIPLHFLDLQQSPEKTKDILFQDYAQHLWGKEFLFEANEGSGEKIIFLARTSVLAANSLLIFLIFLSLSKLWSKRTALLVAFLLATSQFLLAHSMLVTMDAMAGYLSILGLIWMGVWIRRYLYGTYSKSAAFLAALCTAGALVSKSSAILLVPFIGFVSLGYLVICWKRLAGRRWRFVGSLVGILIMTVAFISIWYSWHVRNMTTDDVVHQLQTSYPIDRYPAAGREAIERVAGVTVFGRALAEYAHGMFIVNNRIKSGGFTYYFDGHYYGPDEAQPLYFPVLYLAKQQVAYHLLGALALLAAVVALAKRGLKRSWHNVLGAPEVVLVAGYTVLFMAIGMGSTLLIGLRHVFPVVVGATLLTALGVGYALEKLPRWRQVVKPAILAACGAIVVSLVMSFPYYISYFNAWSGGTENGYKIAVDSNYDWGQDLKLLEKWRRDNNVDRLYIDLHINPFIPLNHYFGAHAEWFKLENEKRQLPSGSYLAVSAEVYQKSKYKDLPDELRYSQYEDHQVARVGTTIFVFRIP